jgi:Family of unknown function (DUF5522)
MNMLVEGLHYYLNEEGLMVLTAKYHLEKGYCCGNGCLHCPFEYAGVPEPVRSNLLSARVMDNDDQKKNEQNNSNS